MPLASLERVASGSGMPSLRAMIRSKAFSTAPSLLQLDPKPGDYYRRPRSEALARLAAPIGSVLDVGCGAGGVGAGLRASGGGLLVGVELNPEAARQAKSIYDEVLCGRAELVLPALDTPFDTILCYDILEHLVDPAQLLREAWRLAKPRAQLHVSVPNARHFSLLMDLAVRGTFGYAPAGHRDNTHLRWFTLRDLDELLAGTGWNVVDVSHPALGRARRLNRVMMGTLTEFLAHQWYIRATRLDG